MQIICISKYTQIYTNNPHHTFKLLPQRKRAACNGTRNGTRNETRNGTRNGTCNGTRNGTCGIRHFAQCPPPKKTCAILYDYIAINSKTIQHIKAIQTTTKSTSINIKIYNNTQIDANEIPTYNTYNIYNTEYLNYIKYIEVNIC